MPSSAMSSAVSGVRSSGAAFGSDAPDLTGPGPQSAMPSYVSAEVKPAASQPNDHLCQSNRAPTGFSKGPDAPSSFTSYVSPIGTGVAGDLLVNGARVSLDVTAECAAEDYSTRCVSSSFDNSFHAPITQPFHPSVWNSNDQDPTAASTGPGNTEPEDNLGFLSLAHGGADGTNMLCRFLSSSLDNDAAGDPALADTGLPGSEGVSSAKLGGVSSVNSAVQRQLGHPQKELDVPTLGTQRGASGGTARLSALSSSSYSTATTATTAADSSSSYCYASPVSAQLASSSDSATSLHLSSSTATTASLTSPSSEGVDLRRTCLQESSLSGFESVGEQSAECEPRSQHERAMWDIHAAQGVVERPGSISDGSCAVQQQTAGYICTGTPRAPIESGSAAPSSTSTALWGLSPAVDRSSGIASPCGKAPVSYYSTPPVRGQDASLELIQNNSRPGGSNENPKIELGTGPRAEGGSSEKPDGVLGAPSRAPFFPDHATSHYAKNEGYTAEVSAPSEALFSCDEETGRASRTVPAGVNSPLSVDAPQSNPQPPEQVELNCNTEVPDFPYHRTGIVDHDVVTAVDSATCGSEATGRADGATDEMTHYMTGWTLDMAPRAGAASRPDEPKESLETGPILGTDDRRMSSTLAASGVARLGEPPQQQPFNTFPPIDAGNASGYGVHVSRATQAAAAAQFYSAPFELGQHNGGSMDTSHSSPVCEPLHPQMPTEPDRTLKGCSGGEGEAYTMGCEQQLQTMQHLFLLQQQQQQHHHHSQIPHPELQHDPNRQQQQQKQQHLQPTHSQLTQHLVHQLAQHHLHQRHHAETKEHHHHHLQHPHSFETHLARQGLRGAAPSTQQLPPSFPGSLHQLLQHQQASNGMAVHGSGLVLGNGIAPQSAPQMLFSELGGPRLSGGGGGPQHMHPMAAPPPHFRTGPAPQLMAAAAALGQANRGASFGAQMPPGSCNRGPFMLHDPSSGLPPPFGLHQGRSGLGPSSQRNGANFCASGNLGRYMVDTSPAGSALPHLADDNVPCYLNAAAAPNRLPAHKPVRLTQPKHPLAPPGTAVYFKYGEEHYPEETVPPEYTITESDGTVCRYITNFLVYNKRGERLLPIENLDQPRHPSLVLYGSLLPASAMSSVSSARPAEQRQGAGLKQEVKGGGDDCGSQSGSTEVDGRGDCRSSMSGCGSNKKRSSSLALAWSGGKRQLLASSGRDRCRATKYTGHVGRGETGGSGTGWGSERGSLALQTYPVRVELAEWCIDYGQEPSNVPFIWLVSRWDIYYRLEKPAGRYIPTFATAKMKFEVSTRVIKTLQYQPDTEYRILCDLLTAATRHERYQKLLERRAVLERRRRERGNRTSIDSSGPGCRVSSSVKDEDQAARGIIGDDGGGDELKADFANGDCLAAINGQHPAIGRDGACPAFGNNLLLRLSGGGNNDVSTSTVERRFADDEEGGVKHHRTQQGADGAPTTVKKKNRNWRIQSLSTPQGTGIVVHDSKGQPYAVTPWGAPYAVDGFKESMLLGLAEFLESQLRNFIEGVTAAAAAASNGDSSGTPPCPNLLQSPFMRMLRERTALRMETLQLVESKRRELEVMRSMAEAASSAVVSMGSGGTGPATGPGPPPPPGLGVLGHLVHAGGPGSSVPGLSMGYPGPSALPGAPTTWGPTATPHLLLAARGMHPLGPAAAAAVAAAGSLGVENRDVETLESEIKHLQQLLKDSDDDDEYEDDEEAHNDEIDDDDTEAARTHDDSTLTDSTGANRGGASFGDDEDHFERHHDNNNRDPTCTRLFEFAGATSDSEGRPCPPPQHYYNCLAPGTDYIPAAAAAAMVMMTAVATPATSMLHAASLDSFPSLERCPAGAHSDEGDPACVDGRAEDYNSAPLTVSSDDCRSLDDESQHSASSTPQAADAADSGPMHATAQSFRDSVTRSCHNSYISRQQHLLQSGLLVAPTLHPQSQCSLSLVPGTDTLAGGGVHLFGEGGCGGEPGQGTREEDGGFSSLLGSSDHCSSNSLAFSEPSSFVVTHNSGLSPGNSSSSSSRRSCHYQLENDTDDSRVRGSISAAVAAAAAPRSVRRSRKGSESVTLPPSTRSRGRGSTVACIADAEVAVESSDCGVSQKVCDTTTPFGTTCLTAVNSKE